MAWWTSHITNSILFTLISRVHRHFETSWKDARRRQNCSISQFIQKWSEPSHRISIWPQSLCQTLPVCNNQLKGSGGQPEGSEGQPASRVWEPARGGTDETAVRTEFLPILQDFAPYRRPLPKKMGLNAYFNCLLSGDYSCWTSRTVKDIQIWTNLPGKQMHFA